jgi:hypothetical protein
MQMVVKDTGLAHGIGRICRSRVVGGRSFQNNHNLRVYRSWLRPTGC